MKSAALLLLAIAGAVCAGETELRGTLTPSAQVKRVVLLDRAQRQEMAPKEVRVAEVAGEFDPKSGAFAFKSLKPDAPYDLFVELNDGTKIEGVDMRPRQNDPASFTDDGRVTIEKHFYGMKQFTNENRILQINANGRHAAVLVELCRTTEFHAGGDHVIWRIERWDYAEQFGAWQIESSNKVLRRFRMSKDEWAQWRWYAAPEWGGLKAGGTAWALKLPDLTTAPGRFPGVKPPEGVGKAEAKGKKMHEEAPEKDEGL